MGCAFGLFIACGLLAALTPASAAAEEPFVIPVAREKAAPRPVLEAHAALSFPLRTTALCPADTGCVMRGGGGVGASFEQRRPSGFGWLVGYDVWFLDTDSVFELGVQQVVRTGMRYTMPTDTVLHPVFELSVGVMGYGDTFDVATTGVLVSGFGGIEVELTETFGLLLGYGMRAFTHTQFRTARDNVSRGDDGFSTEAAQAQLGLTVMM